ncbi:hypothetical protein F5Y17DRAFT_463737 [Xylariaceae sp. FL0594]|nr:hypothetical protein F5Y17DRAFT_463737 [Xylariaceae sp. FL0594]
MSLALLGHHALVRQAPPPSFQIALTANPLAAIVAITSIMLVVVAAKLYARAFIIKKLALDDLAVVLGASNGSADLILDVYILVVALVNISRHQLSTRKKIGVSAVFSTGILSLVASIIVLYYRVHSTQDPAAVWVQVLTPLVLM